MQAISPIIMTQIYVWQGGELDNPDWHSNCLMWAIRLFGEELGMSFATLHYHLTHSKTGATNRQEFHRVAMKIPKLFQKTSDKIRYIHN